MIVLGSKSPRRKMLLEREITKDFLTHSPDINEELSYSLPTPLEAVRDIAKRKCESCIPLFKEHLIICADTIIVLGKEIIHKPKDEDDAKVILRKLSDKTHQVITAYAIYYKEQLLVKHVISDVTFNSLDESLIDAYVASGSPLDKAGGYGIQDNAKFPIVKEYKGSYDNIVGFPINEIKIDIENLKK